MEANNNKAMREALEIARSSLMVLQPDWYDKLLIDSVKERIAAALSAPTRNCEVGTAEEQDNRMDIYCQTRKCESCPLWDNVNNGVRCEFTWSQMPYEEGGAK